MPSSNRSDALFESLEQRVMLSYDPATYPMLADLASTDNTVVRFTTEFGYVDLEMFDQAGPDGDAATAAPNTVANFLTYIRSGEYDGTFFHRMEDLSGVAGAPPDILQGGGFSFSDTEGRIRVDQMDPIANEWNDVRSNIERTIAMAKIGGDPDSATSQWFFNLTDNSGVLDNTDAPDPIDNGGFTVFGRVANDASWAVIQMITALDEFCFADVQVDGDGNETNPLTPLPGGNPDSYAFTDVPITSSVMNVPPGQLRYPLMTEDVLVTLTDVEIIKAPLTDKFYTQTLAMPEGFASPRITESITLTNLDANQTIEYQVIARYESGQRDQVISFGTLDPSASAMIVVHDPAGGNDAGMRPITPYALEVQATASTPGIAASFEHTDFGNTAGEQFVDPDTYADAELMRWNFTTVAKNAADIRSFLVWQNLTDQTATVTATFFDANQTGAKAQLVFELGAFRRGGINVAEVNQLPSNVYGVVVTSDQPIVAAHSQYQVLPNFDAAPVTAHHASTSIGQAGDGSSSHVIPFVTATATGISEVRVLNTTGANALVRIQATRASGINFLIGNLTVPGGTDRAFDLSAAIPGVLSEGEQITLDLYSVTGVLVSAQFRTAADNDFAATSADTELAQVTSFAGLFYDPDDPTGVVDTLSIFNPLLDRNLRYRVDVLFADGTKITGPTFTNLAQFTRVDLTIDDLPNASAIINHINMSAERRFFTLNVATIDTMGAGAAGMLQVTRVDNNEGYTWTSLGTHSGLEVDLDFDPMGPL